MRLEVFCEDRLGLARELLELLATQAIDLRGIEIDPVGIIYLNFPEIEFDPFSQLMAQIRLIPGVKDVRKIQAMPSEREHQEMRALLQTLPDPVFSLNLKGQIELANTAAQALLHQAEVDLLGQSAQQVIHHFNFCRWLEQDEVTAECHLAVIGGQDYLMDIMPVFIGHAQGARSLVSAVVLLKSTAGTTIPADLRAQSDALGFEHVVGTSTKHKQLMTQAKKLAMLDEPLLIQGETGTGKEMLARACHQRSDRRNGAFMVLNCVSMPDDVVESEIFGYARGELVQKGIFEQAHGGTVFLYEIGEMSPHLQVKILRFLQDGTFRRVGEEHEIKVDVRVICSTKKQLPELVASGSFREDLYYRLNVLTLNIPPLRERRQDIAPLTEFFMNQICHELHQPQPELDDSLVDFLNHYTWPGNVRQLRNVLYRALTQVEGGTLEAQHIQLPDVNSSDMLTSSDNLDGGLDDIMKRYERGVLSSLYRGYPSTRKLAKRLGVSHTAIANKLREYGLGKK
ncbi:Transcriptional regulatory protein TyrR [Vibrio stylophorae]|uniref:HTH-type transcriptional regulatory protein TyrR n=1 Tax=Vibrio stylophorae TaxID=659351 RepID=A0ABN8DVA2_9VIBR|nr:transcriptional regulator TyrR [Vibrio stylophorae]CAH0533773.1 Transcriptional regulatory protein TyrR [Vibrio stylophorae]